MEGEACSHVVCWTQCGQPVVYFLLSIKSFFISVLSIKAPEAAAVRRPSAGVSVGTGPCVFQPHAECGVRAFQFPSSKAKLLNLKQNLSVSFFGRMFQHSSTLLPLKAAPP